MIRPVTRPSTARCTLPMYIAFLLSEPNSVSCLRVSDVLDMSHDSVSSKRLSILGFMISQKRKPKTIIF